MVALTGIEPVERHIVDPQYPASDFFSMKADAVLMTSGWLKFPVPAQFGHEAASQDSAFIDRLHQEGITARKTGDTDTLASLWTDDAAALPPGERPPIGRPWVAIRIDGGPSESEHLW